MSTNPQTEEFIRRMIVLFGEPNTGDPEAFFGEYRDELRGVAADVLRRASNRIRATHTYRSWPTPGEVRVAIAACIAAAPRQFQTDPIEYPGWRPGDAEIANRMCRSPIGRQAWRDGWLGGLHQFIAKHHRYPSAAEQAEIIKAARVVDRWARGDESGTPLDKRLSEMAQSLVATREKIAADVFGVPGTWHREDRP